MIPVNRKLGKFEIIRKLARGGMSDVYLGQDESGRMVALKVIEHSADEDTRFSIEAERRGSALQAQLAAVDPRVVQIYETGDADEYFYVSMEYVEGEDLAEFIRRGPMAVPNAVEIAIAICETLEHAHNLETSIAGKDFQGIVHGDIKPRNIRINPRGGVRVLDFGIAKALSLSRRLTRNEFGSVPYASPERLDSGEVDRMSDLWSLAVVLYEMVTGMQPYQAVSTERLERMVRSRIPPPPAPEPCPEPLRRILIKAMDPEPANRYQSAGEFAEELRAFRDGGEIHATVPDPLDGDATRRTFRPDRQESAADGTRRTVPAPPRPHPQPHILKPQAASNRSVRARRIFLSFFLACVIYAGYVAASTWAAWQKGQKLEEEIRNESLTDIDQIWARWTELSKGRSSSFSLYGARQAVKHKLVAAADNVINVYHNGDTPVYEKDWERARAYLGKALTLDAGDDGIRGRMRLCEGHIARINGTSHRNSAQLYEAESKFNEAQQLISKSPDPQLGLARLYVYGLKDIDKADAALEQAGKRGYRLGNRDRSQLADGYRERADRLWYDSRNVRGLPQEKDEARKVISDYKRALELYQQIVPYNNATAMIAKVQSSLEGVQFRLQQLEGGSGWWH
jgi:serine/threonine protein kinase